MDIGVVSTLGQALSDRTRLELLTLIDGCTCVGQLAAKVNLTSATVTHHLRALERAELVEVVRHGRRSVPVRVGDVGRLVARALG